MKGCLINATPMYYQNCVICMYIVDVESPVLLHVFTSLYFDPFCKNSGSAEGWKEASRPRISCSFSSFTIV